MRETIFKKDFVFLRQVVLTKVFPPSPSFRLTFCTYSRYQIPPPQTLQVTHYSSVKKRWRRSHAQLPASNTESYHLFNSEWNSTKNQQTQWQDCFFFLFSVRWESEAPLKSSSVWRRVVVSRTHCRLCPASHAVDMIVEGAGRILKTHWRQKGLQALWSVTAEQLVAATENPPGSAFLHRRNSLRSRPMEPADRRQTSF